MKMTSAIVIWVAMSAMAHSQSGGSAYAKADAAALERIRAAWTGALAKLQERKLLQAAHRAYDEAAAVGASNDTLNQFLASQRVGDPSLMPPPDGDEAAGILADAVREAGAASETVLGLTPSEAQSASFIAHLQRALEADPKHAKWAKLHQARTSSAHSKKDWPTLRTLVMRAAELDPQGHAAGKYAKAEAALAENGGLVVRAPGHFLQALVRLPSGWSPKKEWPVIVSIAGANGMCASLMDELAKAAGKKPYVLVVPMTLGNLNELPFERLPYPRTLLARFEDQIQRPQRICWDMRGLPLLMAELRRRFHITEDFFLTGYSGGGFVVYGWLLHHPKTVRGACLGSANSWKYLESDMQQAENGGCPVAVVTGERDEAGPPRIFPQSDEGVAALGRAGYTRVDRRHLKNRDHDPFFDVAIEVFDAVLAKKR